MCIIQANILHQFKFISLNYKIPNNVHQNAA